MSPEMRLAVWLYYLGILIHFSHTQLFNFFRIIESFAKQNKTGSDSKMPIDGFVIVKDSSLSISSTLEVLYTA